MKNKIKTTARIQVLIEVCANAPWDETCTTAQVYKQAKDDALAKLQNHNRGQHECFTIIGEPKVIIVSTEEER